MVAKNNLPWKDTPVRSARILSAISRISAVLRTGVWQFATAEGLNPTQVDILVMLDSRTDGVRLSWIADQLGVTAASASDAITSLTTKGLIEKQRSADDARAVALRLTIAGAAMAGRISAALDFALGAVDDLSATTQDELFRSLLALIGKLQTAEKFPEIRACLTCRHFAPNVRKSAATAHQCLLANAPLSTRLLRIDCPEHAAALAAVAAKNWKILELA